MLAKINDFYAKEFKISSEKKSTIASLNEKYISKKNTPRKNTPEFNDIFDEKYNDFNTE
ncbi:hypothetical protein KKH82_08805 [Patescibacteria group bacterium]|nr:hypothetical protein [Patescibacteria group bacterium]